MANEKKPNPKKDEPKKAEPKNEKLIYIGPSLSRGRLPFARIYIGGFPEHIKDIIKLKPWFRKLFVPIEKMEVAIAATKKNGDAMHTFYQKAMKEV